jgi:ABC-2 type transport system ATP-binding protein
VIRRLARRPEEPKGSALGEELVGIEAEPQAGALALIEGQGVVEVAPYGNARHAVVPSAAEAMPRLHGLLTGAGVAVGRIDPRDPALEDAFVSLIARQRG